MTIPTVAILPTKPETGKTFLLDHDLLSLKNTQRRLAGRLALVPKIDLDAYRFRAVIDWIEFRVYLGRTTQAQHVQDVLRRRLDRNGFIYPQDLGPGKTFSICTIKVQEPGSLALISAIHRDLVDTFAEIRPSQITGIEISVDAYPRRDSDEARAILVGGLQRTIWTDRDIWSKPNSRPRMVFGRGEKQTIKLSREPEKDETIASRSVPDNHEVPFIDSTMYLGAKEGDDVMIRVMEKIRDKQRPDGSFDALTDDQKRPRIEVTLKGQELAGLGLTDVPSLERFEVTKIKKRYFQFRLPTFAWTQNPKRPIEVLSNMREEWRARTFLKAGITGLMAMDASNASIRKNMMPRVRATLKLMAGPHAPASVKGSPRIAPAFSSWEKLNSKVDVAFQSLSKREKTAWEAIAQR